MEERDLADEVSHFLQGNVTNASSESIFHFFFVP